MKYRVTALGSLQWLSRSQISCCQSQALCLTLAFSWLEDLLLPSAMAGALWFIAVSSRCPFKIPQHTNRLGLLLKIHYSNRKHRTRHSIWKWLWKNYEFPHSL